MTTSFFRNIEIWLSAAGVAVILGVPLAIGTERADVWRVTSITAIGVGVIHGVIFWLVRRRQRQVREETIVEIRGMLKHLINNPLCTIALRTGLMPSNTEYVRDIMAAVDRISGALRNLSDERLSSWRDELAGDPPAAP